MNNTSSRHSPLRPVDTKVEGQAGGFSKNFRLLSSKKIALSKIVLGGMFLAGFVWAMWLVVNTKTGEKYSQSSSAAQTCSNTSVNAIPLNELGAGFYMGYQGGLYPGGSNVIPTEHLNRGVRIAETIQPLDASGQSDPVGGKIGLISLGVSNTRNKFEGCDSGNEGNCASNPTYPNAFKPRADSDPEKNPRVVIVSGAQGGMPLSSWDDEASSVWSTVDSRLSAAGLTPLQVQAAWIELPDKGYVTSFPDSELEDKAQLENVLRIAKTRYPNLKVAYLSSRSYGGYSSKTGSNVDDESAPGKLHAYQSAWVTKWVIEDQINGVGTMNPDPDGNPATNDGVVPWVAWGPYFWADGTTPRSDGLMWFCEDYNADGLHPGNLGVKKVADRLLIHFKTDPTACSWFLASGCGTSGNKSPVANAGSDVTAVDGDDNGTETVVLDGSSSFDPDGSIVGYEWKEGPETLGVSAVLPVNFSVGVHTLTLTVTDNNGALSTDTVVVTIHSVSRIAEGILFDASSSADSKNTASNSLSWNHTVGSSGQDRILVVGVAIRGHNNQMVSSVTYAGKSLTKINAVTQGVTVRSELWYLVNPPVGTQTVTVTLANGAKAHIAAGAVSYTGVNQLNPLGSSVAVTSANGTSVSVNIASASGEMVVDAVAKQNSSDPIAAGTNQTVRWNDTSTHSSAERNVVGGGSEKPGAPSVVMSWSDSVATSWALVAASLKPSL